MTQKRKKVGIIEYKRLSRAPHIVSELGIPARCSPLHPDPPADQHDEGEEEIPALLSNEEWRQLQKLSGLGEEKRLEVENIIFDFRNARRPDNREIPILPAETRKRLLKLGTQAEGFYNNYNESCEDNFALGLLIRTSAEWDGTNIFEFMEQVRSFAILAKESAKKCNKAKPGPQDRDLNRFVDQMAALWTSSTGERISITFKRVGPYSSWNVLEFIIAAAKIATPQMKGQEARIENLVKTRAGRRKSQKN